MRPLCGCVRTSRMKRFCVLLLLVLLAVDIPVSAVAAAGTVTGIFPAVEYAFGWIGSLGEVKSETTD